MVENTGGWAASVFNTCPGGSRVLVNGGCNTKNAGVRGRELTGGGAAEWTNAAVHGCVEVEGQRGGGTGAAGSGGEQGCARHGQEKEGRGRAVIWNLGGVRSTHGIIFCFQVFLRMKGFVNRALVENGREYTAMSCTT